MQRVQIPYKLLLGDAWIKSYAMPHYLHFAHEQRSIKWHICFRDIDSTYNTFDVDKVYRNAQLCTFSYRKHG